MVSEVGIGSLTENFRACQKILTALGDQNRQYLMIEMMQMGICTGVRVGDITEKTHLSRPAVSHHLQILKDAGIIKMREEGTKNFYYFDPDMEAFDLLINTLLEAKQVTSALPNRNEK